MTAVNYASSCPTRGNLETLAHDHVALRCAFDTEQPSTTRHEEKEGTRRHGQAQSQTLRTQRSHDDAHLCEHREGERGIASLRNWHQHQMGAPSSESCGHWASSTHSTTTHADFSRICDGALAISSIMQGAHIEVNEHGVRAAVYTGISIPSAAPQWGPEITFTVDRPSCMHL